MEITQICISYYQISPTNTEKLGGKCRIPPLGLPQAADREAALKLVVDGCVRAQSMAAGQRLLHVPVGSSPLAEGVAWGFSSGGAEAGPRLSGAPGSRAARDLVESSGERRRGARLS